MSDKMALYNLARPVPPEAQKPITAGRLKGFTDVNPMYRIKRLTEMFGPCGIGWWYDITDKRIVDDETTGQRAAFVDINLYYVDPETGKESHGIPGTGGAAFLAKESKGPYLSDECFKMALTDAISVSAKALGIAADVYWQKDRSKYPTDPEAPAQEAPAPVQDNRREFPARRGSTGAAQAAGKAKLEAIEGRLNQAATGASQAPTAHDATGSRQMATDEQKEMLRKMVNLEQLASCTKMYGPNWERMPANAASSLINKIKAAVEAPDAGRQ